MEPYYINEETAREAGSKSPLGFFLSASGSWAGHVKDHSNHNICLSDETLAGLFAKVINYKPIPVIPRRPRPLSNSDLAIVKTGSKWCVRGAIELGDIKRKKDAEMLVIRLINNADLAQRLWDLEFGPQSNGVEGEEFIYGDAYVDYAFLMEKHIDAL